MFTSSGSCGACGVYSSLDVASKYIYIIFNESQSIIYPIVTKRQYDAGHSFYTLQTSRIKHAEIGKLIFLPCLNNLLWPCSILLDAELMASCKQ